jgi:hypothetical protein
MNSRVKLSELARAGALATLAVALAGCGMSPAGVTAAEVQAALERKMPLKRNGFVITAPNVQLGEPEGGVHVCARWELPPSALAGLLQLRGEVCGAGKLRWDRPSCQVKLDAPSLTKASLDNASQLPQRILDPLNGLLTQGLQEVTVYKANGLACAFVKGIRTTAERIEVLI